MATRTSARQAAAKANEAMHESAQAGTKRAPAKRKGSTQEEAPKKKRETKVKSEGAPAKASVKGKEKKEKGQDVNGGPKEPVTQKDKLSYEKEASHGPELVKESEEREKAIPSNILEKGIIYFFFRSRVGVEDPQSVGDVARTFIVLRPLPREAKLGEGPIGDDQNCRLLMLPKKNIPTSSKERYMGFVEKAGTTVKTLRESFEGKKYETKTKGERHVPSATPLAEGVYAITSTGRTSHLAYILTIPSELTEVQTDFGLRNKGSFIVSSKSPKFPGPSSARLPKGPEYPQEVKDEFGDLRWVGLQPKFIDYPNAQILMIGEAQDELGKGGVTEGKEAGRETAGEELEYLEHENEVRVQPLHGDDTVFDDLALSSKDFPKVPTTWE